jgi:imidazole glycerol-phosphate synthase subunit HisH
MGNIHSVYKKLNRICSPVVSSNPNEIISADKIILPGVGHFAKAMNNIVSLGILEALSESVLIKKKPILGICLGMQLLPIVAKKEMLPVWAGLTPMLFALKLIIS